MSSPFKKIQCTKEQEQLKKVFPTVPSPTSSTTVPSPLTTTDSTTGTYRDTADRDYNSDSDEDYDPALESSSEDEEDDEIEQYVDEITDDVAEAGDDAGNVLDELVGMFMQNTGRRPTEEEMQEWAGAMKSLMVNGDGGGDGGTRDTDGAGMNAFDEDCKKQPPAAE